MARDIEKKDWIRFIPESFGAREEYEAALEATAECEQCRDDLARSSGAEDLCTKDGHAKLRDDVRRPLSLEIHWLSAEAYRGYTRKITFERGSSGVAAGKIDQVNLRILEQNVRAIENYRVNGKTVATGGDLFHFGETQLVDEVLAKVNDLSALQGGDRDSLSSRFASARRTTQP